MKIPRILYFSLNPKSVKAFYKYNKKKRSGELLSFRLYSKSDVSNFTHISNLISFLEDRVHKDTLPKYIIIDYNSLSALRSSEKEDSESHSKELILRTILEYPDIYFLFDETRKNEDDDNSFVYFLFQKKYEEEDLSLLKKYHTFKGDSDIKKAFEVITHGRDNLFDGTNLRFFARRYLHDDLKVNRYNFSLFQKSRKDSLALCIEEEYSQNRFNSYALYANGFRVLPVVTATELKYINNSIKTGNDEKLYIKPDLIIRDYDLQFPDADGPQVDVDMHHRIVKINEVDYIRGVKYWDSKDYKKDTCPRGYLDKWQIIIANSSDEGYQYWENLQNIPTFFISKGVKNIELCRTESELSGKILVNKPDPIFQNHTDFQYLRGLRKPVSGIYCPFHYCEIIRERYKLFEIRNKTSFVLREASKVKLKQDANNKNIKESAMSFFIEKYQIKKYHSLYLRLWFLFSKRVLKIHEEQLKQFDSVGNDCGNGTTMVLRFLNKIFTAAYSRISSYIKKAHFLVAANKMIVVDKSNWEEDTKNQEWIINTNRKNREHGVPLDVYDLVQSMLSRAKHFYSIGKYIRSAVISSETIELLNGFHESLMLRAYYYLAISENAIAMNTTGGSEIELIEDTNFRINKIKKEIDRILERPQNEGLSFYERRELKFNILNQIYSECRKYCRDKEYFGPENCFISAIAHINEGFSPLDIRHELGSIWNRIRLIAEK